MTATAKLDLLGKFSECPVSKVDRSLDRKTVADGYGSTADSHQTDWSAEKRPLESSIHSRTSARSSCRRALSDSSHAMPTLGWARGRPSRATRQGLSRLAISGCRRESVGSRQRLSDHVALGIVCGLDASHKRESMKTRNPSHFMKDLSTCKSSHIWAAPGRRCQRG